MSKSLELYQAFLSSPGDVASERDAAKRVFDALNRTCRESLGMSIDLWRWEDQPPVTPNLPAERIQAIINREVERSQFFVLVLNKRYGSVEPGQDKSNTEREIDTILARFGVQPQLKILAYFKKLESNGDPGGQEQQVRDLRDRLSKLGVMYREYLDVTQFQDVLTHDLYNLAMRFRLSPFKTSALNRFWQFGTSERPTHPRIAILYPPVPRAAMVAAGRKPLWVQRLAPHVYFEDHKALRKVEKILNLMGVRDARTYSVDDPPNDAEFMNRIWICMPRNKAGLDRFRRYDRKNQFDFAHLVNGRPMELRWSGGCQGALSVRSPLGKYLEQQRASLNPSDRWQRPFSDIVAKDYAVLARFSDYSQEGTDDGPLRDYFLAGLRGLGTWGAAWYTDRKYKALMEFGTTDDVAVLLEVTYKNGRIHTVVDVSNEGQGYFDHANLTRTIRTDIQSYTDEKWSG